MRIRGPLTSTKFRRWLDGRRPSETVGYGHESTLCPLASFLLDELDADDVNVANETYSCNGETYQLPRWAQWFVRLVDAKHPRKGRIRASEASTLLIGAFINEHRRLPAPASEGDE